MVPITPTWRDVRRAIEIAKHDDLRIVGQAMINGVRVFAIPSRSQPGTVHLPYVDALAQRVICDCQGFQYRGVCAHTMVVTRHLVSEAQGVINALRNQPAPPPTLNLPLGG
jgi:hypothetical protein